MVTAAHELSSTRELEKSPTGIRGLDEITHGGLPAGRSTLVCGNAGCGKTLLGIQFLVNGIATYGEPGVFVAFEETARDLTENVRSLGYDLDRLVEDRKLRVDHVRVERSEIEETGEYDLEGLFVRLGHAIDSIGARRVVLDTLEVLFSGLSNTAIIRAELRRLFRWLKDKGVTAIITAERGREQLTRKGLEEYISDCVILLDHRVHERIATRHLRVVKYRGSLHGTNEYPFLIGASGISVLPITSLGLNHAVSNARISSGIPRLDGMLGGEGFFRGGSVMLSGTPGTGKTSVAAYFAQAAIRRDQRALFFAFEESPNQIVRNMRSIGLRLEPGVRRGMLRFHAARPTLYGLEMHLATMFKEIDTFRPDVVVVDPINSLLAAGSESETRAMVTRLIDYLKGLQITSLFTSLSHENSPLQASEILISSLMDAWLLLQNIESDGERNRGLYVLKSRGMAHSNQIREFLITSRGVDLVDPYIGPGGMLVGAARAAQVAREKAVELADQQEALRARRSLERRHTEVEQQIATLRSRFEAEAQEARRVDGQSATRTLALASDRTSLGRLRQPDASPMTGGPRPANGHRRKR